MAIGKLEEVDIRELWKHEQYDFSEWLSKKENIENLNEILGLTLVDISKETYVGSYRCDLFAKDETTGIKVIIENQLEMSNHDHLGKIITYASGLDAKVVVWIVKEAREEHRSAIEWLNNNTNSNVNFFLIEIHAYKIGNSDNAPMFQVIEQPNDFIKNNKDLINAGIDLVAPKLGVKGNIAHGVVNAISNGPSLRELQLLNSNMNSSDDEVYHETGGMIKPIYK